MPDIDKLAINQVTTRGQWTLAEAIEGYARHGIGAIGIFRDMLAECGLDRAAGLVRDTGMTVTSLCAAGWFGPAAGDRWPAALDDNRRAIEEAHRLGARCLVTIGGGLPPGSKDLPGARGRFRDGVGAILDEARSAGVAIGIEPLNPMSAGDRDCVSTLAYANDLCDELGPGTGVVVDLFHLWWEPDLEAQIARARGRILAFHISDWLVPTLETRNSRGMMGDGVIDIPRMRRAVEAAGYDGYNEVEIMSTAWWQRDPDELVATCIERHRSC